jgi:hypothetical protein
MNRVAEARRFLTTAAAFEDKQQLLVFERKAEYRTGGSSVRRVPLRR